MPQSHSMQHLAPRWGAIIAMWAKVLGIATVVMTIAALILYGACVYMESQILKMGREARALHEDNQNLQIALDRLRSFKNVGEASARLQGMQVATDVIDVAVNQAPRFTPIPPPETKVPKEIYGY